ncbi:class D sortase [Paenibacillus flagellatus]|uniref:Class D sortase n=1 Tax=Paenibacillus flagellatus TaxID=2211139 RepID=A0A2V5K8J7_9BACL|nr:class D sortase [Paenibacillus flagellatus]PYI50080.1 class D sortase [Paenibacillus flagellatus]
MRKILGAILAISGTIILSLAIFQYAEHRTSINKAMAQANVLIDMSREGDLYVEEEQVSLAGKAESAPESAPLADRKAFDPKPNDVIGILQIPKLKADLPIIEGTDEEMLDKGVGHYSASVFPSDGEQIVLSGHRDIVFRNFDKLAVGDRFIVKLPYGTFEYEIKSTDIVDKDDTTVIGPMGTEVLVVTTCYPFRYVGDAPERYIMYAYPYEGDDLI